MRDFLKSARFKILAFLLGVIVVSIIVTAYLGGHASPMSQFLGVLTVPLQKLSSSISGTVSDFFEKYLMADKIYDENIVLREEITALQKQLVNLEAYKRENENYEQVLGIKKQNPAFEFAPAEVIGRDPNDRFYGFTIDRGTFHDVALYDPVITAEGLVGWISQTGANWSKVTTILDVSIDVGAVDTRTRDSGVVTGDIALAKDGLCKLGYLTRDSAVTSGDIIQTSGLASVFGVVFPKGLIIGTVGEIKAESNGIVLYGVIRPAAAVREVKDVFVLTSFPGQGSHLGQANSEESSSSGSSGDGQ